MKHRISRRAFLSAAAAAPAVAAVAQGGAATPADTANPGAGNWVRWLHGKAPAQLAGTTWGTPWPRGTQREATHFALRGGDNTIHALQSWPLAWWPDGSLKWTAHALAPAAGIGDGPFEVIPRRADARTEALVVNEHETGIDIDAGRFVCRLARSGTHFIKSISRAGHESLRDGHLVLLRQDRAASTTDAQVTQENFASTIEKLTLEQRGPVRAVVKVEGKHAHGERQWMPFTLRLYFYAGNDAVRVLHTIVFDGDESRDFIRGLGLRFTVPLDAELHDRHVRFMGEGDGVFGEAVRGLTGLRRDPGAAARDAQIAGQAVPSITPVVKNLLPYVPAFGDWTLFQPNRFIE